MKQRLLGMKTPIVLTAFGTTSRAMDTYGFIDAAVKAAFPQHPVKWAYTSRMVRAHMQKSRNADMKDPNQILQELARQGYEWAMVQSLHLICGHEFYRLIDDIRESPVRVSMGLPLLTEPDDYRDVATAMIDHAAAGNGSATVLIGHGTDHPAWSAYPALARLFENSGVDIYVGTVEGESDRQDTISKVIRKGFGNVHLVPLMLVAGVHLQEDISGDEDSWRSDFESQGISVSVSPHGLGKNPAILEIFIRHIKEALAMIP